MADDRDDLGDLPEIDKLYPCMGEASEKTVKEVLEIAEHMKSVCELLLRDGPLARPSPGLVDNLKDSANYYLYCMGVDKRIT